MKLGFICLGLPGHLNPMTALARELQARNHEVVFLYSSGAGGQPFVPSPEEDRINEIRPEVSKKQGQDALQFSLPAVLAQTEVILKSLPAVVQENGIDALIIDTIQFYAELGAMQLGIPYVHVSAGVHHDHSGYTPLCLFGWPHETTAAALARNREGVAQAVELLQSVNGGVKVHAESIGLKIDWNDLDSTVSPLALITQVPRAFDFESSHWLSQFHHTGPFIDGQGRQKMDFPWERLTGELLIYASMGTILNGQVDVFRTIVAAVAKNKNLQLVLSIGDQLDPKHIGPVPKNAIIAKQVPQLELLKQTAVCITHAGLNTALECLAQGVPQLAIPVTYDQPGVAARIAHHKTGVVTSLDKLTPDHLALRLEEVLTNPTYRENAGKMQKAITEANGLSVAADLIEESFRISKAVSASANLSQGTTTMRDCTRIYIDGAWVEPLEGEVIDVINPATEEPAGQITLCTAADVDRAVKAAQKAFTSFSRSSRQERLDLLSSILGVYAKRQDDLTDALIEELGAPKKFAKEVQVGVGLLHLQAAIETLKKYRFEYYISNRTKVRREPIGVVGAITPWNWPINQLVIKAFPAFATGCSLVHKPSEVAPFTSHVLAEIFDEAGVPAGVYNLVDGDGPTVGAAISAHPDIRMVSFTGSTAAGIDVAKRAAGNVKRVQQELGGKSPNIILDDADLPKSVTENIYRLMLNAGQTCHAPTRMLVPFSKMEAAKTIARQAIASITVGDPQTDVYMGPVVSQRQWNRIRSLVQKGIDEGATLLAGGIDHPDGLETGYYVKPTIFADVKNDMIIAREEIFGPVLCIIGYKDLDDAISIANDTDYGLAAYVQSASAERANYVAARLEAGMVFVNGASEDPEAPFGGYKLSGNGREWGAIGFEELLETKAVIHSKAA